MANRYKATLVAQIMDRFGEIRKLPGSQSLYVVGDDAARIYLRYSKVHGDGRTFFGLREIDLRHLDGHNSFLCFFVDDGSPPLFVPYSDFEEILHLAEPAKDGQYKLQLDLKSEARELYVARQGRFNVEAYIGWSRIEESLSVARGRQRPDFSHAQVQTLLGGIGRTKGYNIRVPSYDIARLDWNLTTRFHVLPRLPATYARVADVLQEIDVLWLSHGGSRVEALFEVEHSTPVYSGLLRFNDVLLEDPALNRFSIVSNETRRAVFSRQLNRPTFRKSGLSELVSFLEYGNVFDWYERLSKEESSHVE